MAPEDEPKSAPEQTERTDSSIPRPRGRRSGRGRRGRGRRPARPLAGDQPRVAESAPPSFEGPRPASEQESFADDELASGQTGDFDPATQSQAEPEPESGREPEAEPEHAAEAGVEAEAGAGVWEAEEPPFEPPVDVVRPPRPELRPQPPASVDRLHPVERAPSALSETYPRQRASPQTVQCAIVEVNQIIRALQESLDGMEEVLETLELAERQKDADEREIESLRRTLRQFQRPREGGHRR